MKDFLVCLCLLTTASAGHAQPGNLLRSGNFESLPPWQANAHLREHGQVTLLPGGQGVTVANPVIDLDGSLYQDVATGGHERFAWSARIRGEGMMRASLGFVSLDAAGRTLAISTPTRVSGTKWTDFSGIVQVPPGTVRLRVLLSVLDGKCSFANLELRKAAAAPKPARSRSAHGQGFAVKELTVGRPFWELFCDDLDGDGRPEIVGCDVDGVVTVRQEGGPATLTFAAGALVYQFAAADLDGDGVKEILLSSVDPKIPVRAIDLRGETVRVFGDSTGPERIAVADMDGDGRPEVAVSRSNGVPGSGVAAGVVLYDAQGRALWEKQETLRTFQFGDLAPGAGKTLVVGGPGVEFRIYDREGKTRRQHSSNKGQLEQFQVTDGDGDGTGEIVASFRQNNRLKLICLSGNTTRWEAAIPPELLGGGSDGSAWHECADFDPASPGKETVVVGTHGVAMFDAKGVMTYQSKSRSGDEYWQKWAPGGINSLDIACWHGPAPHLYLSSSRFRHQAYYRLQYGGPDQFSAFKVPDQEKHLEDIHAAVKSQPARPAEGREKVKVFIAASEFARASPATLREYRASLDALETPSLEYLVMYEASDLLGHERGFKLTTGQIVERARMLEQARIPFGYFAAHGGQVLITREAIRRSKEAAPTMFRFLYIAENLETLYGPLYPDMLKWTGDMLDFCAAEGMKMLFKEKHDVWGLLPSDPEVSRILFSPAHREAVVPIWSTNQPYQPEIQLGGMLGLKLAGWCREFGMSTQFWNWHEWGRYPRGIRDVSATYVCPSDIMLRLELTGLALGGTWVHVEGGQPYLRADLRDGVAPTALRHRELAYELIRKNLLTPGATPVNLSRAVVLRSFHPALEEGKAARRKVAYPYYDRNTPELRQGFIPARYLFETYSAEAFPRLAYDLDWNVRTCFPPTPHGWLPVLPADAPAQPDWMPIITDGERVRLDGEWQTASAAAATVAGVIARGAEHIPLETPGASLIIQPVPGEPGACVALLLDPGYLAPSGVNTTVTSTKGPIRRVTDLVSGAPVDFSGRSCPVRIQPGAFRLLRIELNPPDQASSPGPASASRSSPAGRAVVSK